MLLRVKILAGWSARRFCAGGSKNFDSLERPVRVRFAPSPTGYLHMGGLRTVVYNYLFAKAHKGKFILRVEDTDQKRIVANSLPNLLEMLRWLGLTPDEGPGQLGGPFGPYAQSQRLEIYKKKAQNLVEKRAAYHCFCNEDRLMMLRNEALKNCQPVRYDAKCRHLTDEEVRRKLATGTPHVLRFKLEPKKASFDDAVFGPYNYTNENEGDFVLMKSDGFPTYHFANVVDDNSMEISHVLRGEEWLVSTPKHIEMYQAFGWEPPVFAHLPLMKGLKGAKLSKRDKSAFVEHYKDAGYYPLALINSVCSTGRGFKEKDKQILYEMPELIEKFDLSLVSRQSTRFEPLWLKDYNFQCINKKLDTQSMVEQLKMLIRQKYNLPEKSASESLPDFLNVLDTVYVKKCLNHTKSRISLLSEMLEKDLECLWTIPDSTLACYTRKASVDPLASRQILQRVKILIENLPPGDDFKLEAISKALKTLCLSNQQSFSFFMQILRAAVCGCEVGLPVAEVFELLGQKTVVNRLDFVLDKIDRATIDKNSCKTEHQI